MSRPSPNRGMFLYAALAVMLAFGLAAFGQEPSRVYNATYFQTLKGRVFQKDASLEFERYEYNAKGSTCTLFEHGFMVVFRYRGAIYSASFYCDAPGMFVLADDKYYGDFDLDGRIDIVLSDHGTLFYDYPYGTKAAVAVERRTKYQHHYDAVFRHLERILPSSI